MGNLSTSGMSASALEELEVDISNYPPWGVVMAAFNMDVFCSALRCRHSWRNYVPYGLADKGGWLSEEFAAIEVMNYLKEPLTFEEFQAQKGFEVTPGSGAFAGWQNFNQWSKSAYEYMFQTSSTSFTYLFSPTAICTVFLLVLFIKAVKAVVMPQFQSIGRGLARKTHGEAWLVKNEERIIKFGEYVFRLCYHSFIAAVGFLFFWNAPWLDESKGGIINLYVDFPNDPVTPQMTWYYLIQSAYNVDAMISLLQLSFQVNLFPKNSISPISIGWSDTVRGDFNEMLAHHLVTNALIYMSSFTGQARIGSMVFWMHDISDVPVDLCKLANFVKWKVATVVAFVVLCAFWAYTRLYILPFVLLKSVYQESIELVRGGDGGIKVPFYAFQPLFLVLLGILVLLHFVWFSMFIKMGLVLVSTGETHDMTEHKNGEKLDDPNGVTANGSKSKTKTN